jgi:hypothetical protein
MGGVGPSATGLLPRRRRPNPARSGSDLEGVVVDAQGRPVPGATVVYANSLGNKAWSQLSATTDAEGRFALPVPPGMAKESQFQLGARGKGSGIGFAVVQGAKAAIRIRLAGGGLVRAP